MAASHPELHMSSSGCDSMLVGSSSGQTGFSMSLGQMYS